MKSIEEMALAAIMALVSGASFAHGALNQDGCHDGTEFITVTGKTESIILLQPTQPATANGVSCRWQRHAYGAPHPHFEWSANSDL